MATNLYPTDDQHTAMRQLNAVLAIGHIGCHLKDYEEITHNALTILQQRFYHPPSSLDSNIIEQFASILLTGAVSNF